MRRTISIGMLLLAVATDVAAQGNPILDAPGLQANRSYSSTLPFEHVDTVAGGLVLRFTDLALPGNAGRVLEFQRAWNSKTNQWSYGIAGIPLEVTCQWPAVAPLSEDVDPSYVTVDGGEHVMAFQLDPSPTVEGRRVMVDDRFWRFDRESCTLWMTDGWSATYPSGQLSTLYDPYGNVVLQATWTTSSVVFKHYVNHTDFREITLTWSSCGGFACEPRTMTYAGRQWTYDRTDPASPTVTVTLPEGLTWIYEHYHTLLKVTTPYGSRIEYTFEEEAFPNVPEWGETVYTEVTKTRTTFTREGTLEGTTTYTYTFDSPDFSTSTIVTAPDGRTNTFEHAFLGAAEEAYGGRTFVVTARTTQKGAEVLETETRDYVEVPVQLGTLPELSKRTITRGSVTSSTTYCYAPSNYGDYHQPYMIIEDGELDRTTIREFAHSIGAPANPNVVGMVTRERLVAAAAADCLSDPIGPTAETTRTYETVTGFPTGETAMGIATTFTRDAFGNLERVTRGNGTWAQHAFTNGTVSSVTTSEPGYQISRAVNADGTVASETQAGRTTNYTYDALGRLRVIVPPAGNDIVTTYGATSVTTTRGAPPVLSQVTTTLDGFGRPVRTEDATGVNTRTAYDAEGRVNYQSLPFVGTFEGPTDIGTTTEYDALGRVTREQHADGTARVFSYSGSVTTATDENGRPTVLTRKVFGHPDDARLTSLRDPAGALWTYQYDLLGQLTSMDGPDAVTRTWSYDSAIPTLLRSESHPESGTVTLTEYDAAGLLKAKTDANGTTFQYAYDGNDRLTTITTGAAVTTIAYEPGTDNLRTTVVEGVASEFTYDAAGRLDSRIDTVDGKPFVTDFDYDGNDNLVQVTYPSGRNVAFEYGAENRLIRVFNPSTNTNYASAFQYHPAGAPASYTSGNGIVTTMTYDPLRYWISGITAGEMNLGYTLYDNVGNVKTLTDSRFGTQTFTYDVMDRLDDATGPYGPIDLAYDAHGNRADSLFSYDAANRFRVTSYGGLPMAYDSNGNMTTRSGDTFAYTPDNLVRTATVGGLATNYAYDADAWRVKKAVAGGATTYYVRGPDGQLLMEWINTSPTATVHDYIYAGSQLIAVIKGEVPPK